MWELPSWQSFYRLAPSDWPQFREHVRDLLADGPLTRAELAAALRRNRRYRHLGTVIEDGNDTLLKPLSWQGDVGLGPPRDGEPTLLRLDSVAGWRGVPPLDEAGATVLTHYFRTYGPAPADRVFDWFGKGLGVKRRTLVRWLDDLAPRLEPVDVDGDRVLVLAEDLAELRAARISTALRLLPARDVWVMAPGSSDERVVPAAHRDVVSRFSNLVVWRGRVGGTWSLRGEALEVTWFPESGTLPSTELSEQAEVLGQLLDRSLAVRVQAG
jgi:hypothetical protein